MQRRHQGCDRTTEHRYDIVAIEHGDVGTADRAARDQTEFAGRGREQLNAGAKLDVAGQRRDRKVRRDDIVRYAAGDKAPSLGGVLEKRVRVAAAIVGLDQRIDGDRTRAAQQGYTAIGAKAVEGCADRDWKGASRLPSIEGTGQDI